MKENKLICNDLIDCHFEEVEKILNQYHIIRNQKFTNASNLNIGKNNSMISCKYQNMYLDIETTGLNPNADDITTMVWLIDGEWHYWVEGETKSDDFFKPLQKFSNTYYF